MTNGWIRIRQLPIIRVFISSTFRDLKLERDALQEQVFPKLEQLCLKEGFQFQAIDLRWGVSTEAGLDHRTMQICFEELRRSQEISPEPNFLILLGNRYGWRPLPERISVDEFRSLEVAAQQLRVMSQHQSPVEVLRRWYRLDENSLTPIYFLQPRRRPKDDNPGGKDYTTANAWREVEQVLWQIINRTFSADGLKGRFASSPPAPEVLPRIVRFQASATEQEIWSGLLSVRNANQHVFAFFREIDQPQNIRDAGQFGDFFDVALGEIDPVAQVALRDLKDEIKKRLRDNAVELPAAHLISAIDSSGPAALTTDHINDLCREVELRLKAIIERQIKEYWRDPQAMDITGGELSVAQRSARELEIERDEHLRFGNECAPKETFVGRKDQLERILAYIENDSQLPMVIQGDSGCGKTALLARAFQEISTDKKPIIRFIGMTPGSSDLSSLLNSLCQELHPWHPIAEALPSDVHDLVQEFQKCLEGATSEKPIILFLDALDQLSEANNGRQLFWIPLGQLPGHVKIVVSCLSDREENDPVSQPYIALQRRNLPVENILNLDVLSLANAKTLLFDRWLAAAGRTVNEAQRNLIKERLESFAVCRQPLYIKLLFEEAKLWRSYDELGELGGSVPELLQQLCQRLSRPENHGESLVRLVLGYVAAARRGLSEQEILEVLFADPDYKNEIDEVCQRNNYTLPNKPPRIPIAIWSRLRSELAPYLTVRSAPGGSVLTLYHRQVSEWVTAHFIDAANWNPHGQLAEFFGNQDYFLESLEEQRVRAKLLPPTPRPVNIRKVDELPYHLLEVARHVDLESNNPEAKEWNIVADLLTDWQFLEAKAEAQPTMIFDLLQDLAGTIDRMPVDHPKRHILALLEEAVRRDRQFIDRHPTTLFQCLWNSCWWYDSPSLESYMSELSARLHGLEAKLHDRELTNRSARGEHGYLLMENWLQNKTPNMVWVKSHRPPSFPLGDQASISLRGPKDEVWSVAASPDGRTVVGGVQDGSIFIWDLPSGKLRLSFKAHQTTNKNGIRNIEFLSDGQSFASHAEDGVRFWDATSGFPLSQEDGRVSSYCKKRFATFAQTKAFKDCLRSEFRGFYQLLAISPNERYAAIANNNRTIQIIDTTNHEEIGRFQLDTSPCSAVFSPDGKLLAAVSEDGEHALWDVVTRTLEDKLQLLYEQNDTVRRMRFSPDGQRLAVLCGSNAVDVLDIPSMNIVGSRFLAHRDLVTSVDFLPGDGHQVVSGSCDRSVMVWNSDDFHHPIAIEGHSSTIRNIVFSTDGQRIITSAKDGTLVWDAESGRLILSGDEPSSKGSTNGLVGWSDPLETTIEEPLHSTKVAWFPASLSNLTSHPSRRIWAGSQLNDIYILELIGDFDTAGLGHTSNASRPVGLLFQFEDFRDIGGAIADLEKAGYIGRRKLQFTLVVKATGTGELPAISEALVRFQRNFRFIETSSWDD